jgi:hypothetical protein
MTGIGVVLPLENQMRNPQDMKVNIFLMMANFLLSFFYIFSNSVGHYLHTCLPDL